MLQCYIFIAHSWNFNRNHWVLLIVDRPGLSVENKLLLSPAKESQSPNINDDGDQIDQVDEVDEVDEIDQLNEDKIDEIEDDDAGSQDEDPAELTCVVSR
jgi:hypothetical protein